MEVSRLKRRDVINECRRIICTPGCGSVVTLNSLMLRSLWRNFLPLTVIRSASLITADSSGTTLASLVLEGKKVRRYPGIDLMKDLIAAGYRVFFVGGEPGVAEAAAARLTGLYPRASVLGSADGFFNSSAEKKIISEINRLKPDIVFAGLDLPRQEVWISRVKERLDAGMIMGVGGSFDVLSGRLRRAPRFMRAAGAEWIWRVYLEPWRFCRVLGLSVFIVEVTWRFFRGKGLFI